MYRNNIKKKLSLIVSVWRWDTIRHNQASLLSSCRFRQHCNWILHIGHYDNDVNDDNADEDNDVGDDDDDDEDNDVGDDDDDVGNDDDDDDGVDADGERWWPCH